MLNRDDPKAKEDSSSNVGGGETAMVPESRDEANPSTIDKYVAPGTEQSPRDADESEENASEKEEEKESSEKEEEKESSEVEEDYEGEKEVGEEEKEVGDEEKEAGEKEKEPAPEGDEMSPEEMTNKVKKGRPNQYENMRHMQRR